MIKLGKEAQDKITGFKGIITGRAEYLTGCNQYILTPKVKKGSASPAEGAWFDEGSLEIIGKGISAKEVQTADTLGGPQRDAPPTR